MSLWNKCDNCGKIIAFNDFLNGAYRDLVTPSSDRSEETWATLCIKCSAAGQAIVQKARER